MKKIKQDKSEALNEIVNIASQYHISLQEIQSAFNTNQKARTNPESMMKLFAYLGGIFIFSGICIYLGSFWPSMHSATRIATTLGTGIAIYILAILLPKFNTKNEQLLSPLILTSAFFQTVGLFVALNELRSGMEFKTAPTLIFGVMLIQQILTLKKIKRATLVFTSLIYWTLFFISFLDLAHASEKAIYISVGTSLLCIAYYLDKRNYKAVASFWFFIAGSLFLNGFFELLKGTWVELLFFAICGGILYLSTHLRNRSLLFVSTIAIFGYIGYFTNKHFLNSAAWTILLVLSGCLCIGAATFILKLTKKYMR